jgi:hypothetical protein
MDELIVVTHPEPVRLEARPLEVETPPEGNVALAYYCDGHLLARGYVASDAVRAINGILSNPVSVALAATEDQSGNIDARFCLVLPVDSENLPIDEDDDAPEEPWRASLPAAPTFRTAFNPPDVTSGEDASEADDEDDEDDRPRVALLPIGNVVRDARERHHPDDIAGDLRDMLANLIEGRARDAVAKAIDDLLKNL